MGAGTSAILGASTKIGFVSDLESVGASSGGRLSLSPEAMEADRLKLAQSMDRVAQDGATQGGTKGVEGIKPEGRVDQTARPDALNSQARVGAQDAVVAGSPAEARSRVTWMEGVRPVEGKARPEMIGGARSSTAESGAVGAAEAGSRDRALKTFGFDASAKPSTAGDAILGGLEKIRTMFTSQTDRINGLISNSSNLTASTGTIFQMQVEVVQYSLLMDLTSKLVGKTTQTVDTLMKGQ